MKGQGLMIYVVISANAVPGKVKEGEEYGANVVAHVNQNYPDTKAEFLAGLDGRHDRYSYTQRFASLGAYESFNVKLAQDDAAQAIIATGRNLFTDRETHMFRIVAD